MAKIEQALFCSFGLTKAFRFQQPSNTIDKCQESHLFVAPALFFLGGGEPFSTDAFHKTLPLFLEAERRKRGGLPLALPVFPHVTCQKTKQFVFLYETT